MNHDIVSCVLGISQTNFVVVIRNFRQGTAVGLQAVANMLSSSECIPRSLFLCRWWRLIRRMVKRAGKMLVAMLCCDMGRNFKMIELSILGRSSLELFLVSLDASLESQSQPPNRIYCCSPLERDAHMKLIYRNGASSVCMLWRWSVHDKENIQMDRLHIRDPPVSTGTWRS